MRYATFDRNIDKPHRDRYRARKSELCRLFLPRALLSMQIQTCTNFAATRLHHNATFNVIAILRHDLCMQICSNGIGQLRDTSLNTVSRLSHQIGTNCTSPLEEKSGPTSSSMPSSSQSLTSFFFSIRVPHMAASGHSAVHSRRYGLYSFREWILDRHRVR